MCDQKQKNNILPVTFTNKLIRNTLKKIIIFYYLYLCSFVALSQNLDDAYSLLGKENYDSAILVSRLVSEKTSNTNTKGDALYLIAYCYQVSHDYSEAVNYYLQAEKSYTIDKCKARANGNIGAIYRNTGLYKEAIDHQTQAIKLWANEVSKGNSLIDRAIAYKHKALHDLAIVDGLEALRIGYINNNEKLQIRALNQLGLIQKDIEDFGEATVYFKKAKVLP